MASPMQLVPGLFDQDFAQLAVRLFLERSFPVIIGLGFAILAALVLDMTPDAGSQQKFGLLALSDWMTARRRSV